MRDGEERVILVDENDRELGSAGKLEVHRSGMLHRAFSIFLTNPAGEMLLQRRARGKYHSGGLWSNACCGHPRPGESTPAAASRRLTEELGLTTELHPLVSFTYAAELGAGLREHELDHLFAGAAAHDPVPDPDEVEDWQWLRLDEVRRWMEREPAAFTAWFPPALEHFLLRHREVPR